MDIMETTSEDRSDEDFSIENQNLSQDLRESRIPNDDLLAELEALRTSFQELQSRSLVMEDNLTAIQQQKDEALKHNFELVKAIEEISSERDALQNELHGVELSARKSEDDLIRQRDEEMRAKLDLHSEVEVSQERIRELLDEKSKRTRVLSQSLDSLRSVKECLLRVIERIDEEKSEIIVEEGDQMTEESDLDEESKSFLLETMAAYKLVFMAESKLTEYEEMRKKEKRELENSVVSLTEENRDINSLLRIALVEKDAVEKTLSRLKGNSEQKRVALLQIAERGLQKVGFGFMMGTSTGDSSDNSGSNAFSKSDSSEGDEEIVSVASMVEKIMKNLRLEITQLKRSLEESRSDTERLQSLTEKQAQKIAENTLYIKELEERETMLAHNVEELMMEITEAEEEAARWREACELEVEAGKNVIEERDREVYNLLDSSIFCSIYCCLDWQIWCSVDEYNMYNVGKDDRVSTTHKPYKSRLTLLGYQAAILREELAKTKASLDLSNSKLALKEELAATAMTAQAASEKSLRLADSRAAGLRERIEELTRQLEEADSRGDRSSRRRVRHICWPWRALRVNPAATSTRARNVRRMLPEMQALLHFSN
ncbi:hypothetical protein HHK36_027708 [Tetracentron sinense]|uniref:Uncharacterized protein n=1 Tax=Tetracentron sinense TaxID=13715 RepID=A0A834YDP0_TETSI|nr:hypothetical protein HHK36_027708 [Tetracentron sinense]